METTLCRLRCGRPSSARTRAKALSHCLLVHLYFRYESGFLALWREPLYISQIALPGGGIPCDVLVNTSCWRCAELSLMYAAGYGLSGDAVCCVPAPLGTLQCDLSLILVPGPCRDRAQGPCQEANPRTLQADRREGGIYRGLGASTEMPSLWLGLAAACLLVLRIQAQSPSPALTSASLIEGHATEYGSARVRTTLEAGQPP